MEESKKTNSIVQISLVVIIIGTFLLFTPKVASTLFPFKRHLVWKAFIHDVREKQRIDPQSYWKFREFYSPGYFILSKTGLSQADLKKTEAFLPVSLPSQPTLIPFAAFTSKYLHSVDSLASRSALSSFITIPSGRQVLFKNNNSVISLSGKTVTILFLMPESEMEKANGFFDYGGVDKKAVQGKYWLNVTSLTLE